TCLYEGENCYIWGLGDAISEEEAKSYGEEFDAAVYPVDTETFGQARFTENGGKINLLFYSFNCSGNTMTLGYFRPYDLFSTEEAGAYVDVYQMNTDHAIVHINSQAKDYDDELVFSTMGHEFQHLICFSDVFAAGGSATLMRTWLNESMSAYAEDLLYPGSKDKNNYNIMFYASEAFRKGQSLYNFDVSQDENLGAYGIVYLFSEYLADLSGEDIFSKIHSFWRENPAAVTEAQAIATTVPENVYSEIDKNYTYNSSVEGSFADEYEAWMSKLTLDFYLNTFQTDMANLGDYEEKCFELMQYNEVNPLDVEGGGRVFVQTKDNQYAVPTDADDNLIYVGLDENFNIVDTYGVNE
ncbi:MAG: hypothetical protein Q4B15_08900, partial [Lachnospiraceae bacterium]|nr:hypothetical protein [Lachnospiraceae bacterium]